MSKKTKMTAVLAIILMASMMIIAVNPVQGQALGALAANQPYSGPIHQGDYANGTIPTTAQISARPYLVGKGQPVLFNLWITPASIAGRKLLDFEVKITKPDGTLDDFVIPSSERDTAAAWFEYTPDQIGEYTYQFIFPGTFLPPGVYNDGIIYVSSADAGSGYQGAVTIFTGSSYYQPSTSPVSKFFVQEEIVPSWAPYALPTDYWTRPVSPEHREWVDIIGDFPWYGPGGLSYGGVTWEQRYPNSSKYWNPRMDFYPYVQGPNSAHIVWKRYDDIAGINGAGRYANYGAEGYSYDVPFSTTSSSPSVIPIVIGGRGYKVIQRSEQQIVNGSLRDIQANVLRCVDIRTGEILWEKDGFDFSQSQRSFGSWVFQGSIEYPSLDIVYLSGGRLYKFNENTGSPTVNVSIDPLTSGLYYMNGFALSVQNLGNNLPYEERYRLINWTTLGSSSNFTSRIVSNISWPLSSLPATTDYTAGIAASFGRGLIGNTGTTPEQRLVTVSLTTGEVLVNKSFAPAGNADWMGYSGASDVCDHGIYAFLTAWGQFQGLDIRTGAIRWTSPQMDYPWDSNGFGAYDTTSAYGMFFRCAYSGVYAFDWETGAIVWKYKAPAISPFETPYIDENGQTIYSFNGVNIAADGKIYTINTEHTPTQPYTRGWQIHCINAYTGEGIWKTMMTGNVDFVADGYLGVSESYTSTYYVFGRGKSETTVAAPDTAVPLGTAIVLKGSVLDMSPAQPGTPCVSKDSMATQMEYLHRQMPINGLWGNLTITGVPVALAAVAEDGTYYDLGTATTDGYYGTFSKAWTPPAEGSYEFIASFAADDSYGSSSASTFAFVGPAPEPYPTPTEPEQPVDNSMLLYAILAAVIVAIVLALAALFWKR
jgi:hypothetical protein